MFCAAQNSLQTSNNLRQGHDITPTTPPRREEPGISKAPTSGTLPPYLMDPSQMSRIPSASRSHTASAEHRPPMATCAWDWFVVWVGTCPFGGWQAAKSYDIHTRACMPFDLARREGGWGGWVEFCGGERRFLSCPALPRLEVTDRLACMMLGRRGEEWTHQVRSDLDLGLDSYSCSTARRR